MSAHTHVLVVDGGHARAPSLLEVLAAAGYEAYRATDAASAAGHPSRHGADVVLLSFDAGGLSALTQVAAAAPDAEIVVQCDAANEAEAREALRFGACDVVARERGTDALLHALERAARDARRRREVAALRARLSDRAAESLVGRSAPMLALREVVGRAAAGRMTVLVTGEQGAGKDIVARLIHDLSERAARPFVVVRMQELQALSGSVELLERARGGTLVIEEPENLPRQLRAKVAALLEARRVDRDGGTRVPVDVRVILTTRTAADRAAGASDEELLGESDVLRIAVPPLRERRGDIPLLIGHFRERMARDTGVRLPALEPQDIVPLLARQWPGNVRELEHSVERMVYAAAGYDAAKEVPVVPAAELEQIGAARLSLDALERMYIRHVLALEQGHQTRAAERLGIDRRTLYRKLKDYREEEEGNE